MNTIEPLNAPVTIPQLLPLFQPNMSLVVFCVGPEYDGILSSKEALARPVTGSANGLFTTKFESLDPKNSLIRFVPPKGFVIHGARLANGFARLSDARSIEQLEAALGKKHVSLMLGSSAIVGSATYSYGADPKRTRHAVLETRTDMLDIVALFSALKMAGASVYAFRRPEITDNRVRWRGGLSARWFREEGVTVDVNANLKLAGCDEEVSEDGLAESGAELNVITIEANLDHLSDAERGEEILRRGLARFLARTGSHGLQWSISEAPARGKNLAGAIYDTSGATGFSELAKSRGHYSRLRVNPLPQAYMMATALRDDLKLDTLDLWTTGLKIYLGEDKLKALKGLPQMEDEDIEAWTREHHAELAAKAPSGHHAILINGHLIASSRLERELVIFCNMLYEIDPETRGTSWLISPHAILTGEEPQEEPPTIRGYGMSRRG